MNSEELAEHLSNKTRFDWSPIDDPDLVGAEGCFVGTAASGRYEVINHGDDKWCAVCHTTPTIGAIDPKRESATANSPTKAFRALQESMEVG